MLTYPCFEQINSLYDIGRSTETNSVTECSDWHRTFGNVSAINGDDHSIEFIISCEHFIFHFAQSANLVSHFEPLQVRVFSCLE